MVAVSFVFWEGPGDPRLFCPSEPMVSFGTSLKKSKKTSANIAVSIKVSNPFGKYGQLSRLGAKGPLSGTPLGRHSATFRSGGHFWSLGGDWELPLASLGRSWGSLGRLWASLGRSRGSLGTPLVAALASLGVAWVLPGVAWAPLGAPLVSLGHPGPLNSQIPPRPLNPLFL